MFKLFQINRQAVYIAFLEQCTQGKATIADIIALGEKVMKKSSLHHHFFGDFTWKAQSMALVKFGLKNLNIADNDLNLLISEKTAQHIINLFEQRITQKIPVEYITHEAIYRDRLFYVNEHVLVPRSIMSTRFEDFLKTAVWENYRVLDLCTGSGCIGITLALMDPRIQVDLADISPKALEVAAINIEKFGLQNRVHCIQSDGFEHIDQQYDLIITNPPYVSEKEYNQSPDEFKNEPKMALEAGKDGLNMVHKILAQAQQHLNSKGILIAEVGYPAAKRIKKRYRHIPFQWYKYRRPNGHESFFGDHGVFLCHRKDLLLQGRGIIPND